MGEQTRIPWKDSQTSSAQRWEKDTYVVWQSLECRTPNAAHSPGLSTVVDSTTKSLPPLQRHMSQIPRRKLQVADRRGFRLMYHENHGVCSLLHGDLPPQALPHPRPPGPGLPVDSGSPWWQPPSPWGLCWGLASGRIPSGASASWGSLKELRSSSGIPLPGPRGSRQHVAGLRLRWAWQPGIQGERKEFAVEGTDLEWQGLKRQEGGVGTHQQLMSKSVMLCFAGTHEF